MGEQQRTISQKHCCCLLYTSYGPEIVLAGVDPQRVYDFSFMLIEEIDECPGQAAAPGLSME